MKKILITLLLCIVSNAMKAEIASGTCGSNITWSISDDYVLTLSGSGPMMSYTDVSYVPWYNYRSKIIGCSIAEGITSIGDRAFELCNALTSITIPNSVTWIGMYAFRYCYNLETIIVDSANEYFDSRENCNAIISSHDNSLIVGCKNTIIPNSVIAIGDNAFADCIELNSINIPSSVVYIGYYAFKDCDNLTSINIPSSVSTIYMGTFRGCRRLKSVTIPNSVTSIGESAFTGCRELTSINIPGSVTTIENLAFYGCNKLDTIFCHAETPPTIFENTFDSSIYSSAFLIVPDGCSDAYKSANYWKNFTNINEGGVIPEKKKCAKPTIAYEDGRLYYYSATPDVLYKHTIVCEDSGNTEGNETILTATYHISAYATRNGYENSDIAYATLVWASATFTPDDETEVKSIQIPSTPLLITQNSGILSVSSIDDGEAITAYSLSGTKLTTAVVTDGSATLDLSSESGNVVILNVNGRSAKILVK